MVEFFGQDDERRIKKAKFLLEEEILPEELEYEDLYNALLDCNKHKAATFSAEKFELNDLLNLGILLKKINSSQWEPNPMSCFIIKDPTIREIWASEYEDRILHHFMLNEILDILEEKQGSVCYNCRIGYGTDRAIKKVAELIKIESENFTKQTFYLKGDFSAFFMNIDKVVLLQMVYELIEEDYKGKYLNLLKYLFRAFLLRDPTKDVILKGKISERNDLPENKSLFNKPQYVGFEIGTLLAQNLCNLYLREIFDKYIESDFKVIRYVDDWIVISRSRVKLRNLLSNLSARIKTLNILINFIKTKIRNIKYGIDFLGKRIYPYCIVWQQKTIDRFYAQSRLVKSPKKLYLSTACRRGTFIYFGGRRLALNWYKKISDKIKENFKLFNNMKCAII